MAKPRVYIQGAWNPDLYLTPPSRTLLEESFDLVVRPELPAPASEAQTVDRLRGCAAILSLNGADDIKELTGAVIRKAGTVRTAVIGHWWHHCHEPMIAQWKPEGVDVLDVSDGCNQATAEWATMACMMAARRVIELDRGMKSGGWPQSRFPADLVCESTIGVIGLGRVGRIVAKQLKALDAHVLGWDGFLAPEAIRAAGAEPAGSLDELMRRSDIVTMHLPITDATKGLVSANHFALMRDGTAFVNAGRAWTCDNAALLRELQSGRLRAFLDVYEQEPLAADDPLRNLPNAVLNAHVAGSGLSMFVRIVRLCADALRSRI